ncbi:MAG: hypothetical protein PHW60_09380 [Kiritimatiellae bacterium]|nr:hypothetical protein [Kiritimatiellia bacterium]
MTANKLPQSIPPPAIPANLLRRHDFVYERPPSSWHSCVPLANGFIGAALWGDGRTLKISLDKYDVWETRFAEFDDRIHNFDYLHNLRKAGQEDKLQEGMDAIKNSRVGPGPTKLPVGTLEIAFAKTAPAFTGRLKLAQALFDGPLASVFVCRQKNVVALKFKTGIRACGMRLVTVAGNIKSADARKAAATLKSWGYPLPEEGRRRAVSYVRQSCPQGLEYTVAWLTDRTRGELFIAIVSSNDAPDTLSAAMRLLEETRNTGWSALLKEHVRQWKSYWAKSWISIPDGRLENLYYAELYKLGCSSRPGSLPATLQALWTYPEGMPPWRGEYALNMNVQESYWPVYASNHLECGEPLYEIFFKNLPFNKAMGRKFYGKDVPLIFSASGPGGEPCYGWVAVTMSPGGGAWLSHHYWLHWLYSRDAVFLRTRAFPFMRECLNVYMHIAEKSADGAYHIPFCNTPEYFGGKTTAWSDDNTYDLDLARFLAQALLEAEAELGIQDPLHRAWEDFRDHLTPCHQDEREGLMLAKGIPLATSHRHHSHLMGLYPLGTLRPDRSPEEKALVEKSIRTIERLGTGYWVGWSWPWASLIAGRAGCREAALAYLQTYVDAFISDNTFHVNGDEKHKGFSRSHYGGGGPVTLEAGFAYAAAVLELLLQSQGGVIRLFPGAMHWPDASFDNLRAEGAFLVSAVKRAGAIQWMRIHSEKGGLCRIADPFDPKGGIRHIRTQAGKTYTLGKVGRLAPVSKFDRRTNWFGTKNIARF